MVQLLPREDGYIGTQECLAIIAGVYTCPGFHHCCLSIWADNMGTLHNFIRGGSDSPEVNLMVARFWLWAAEACVHVELWWVPSASNIADGPSRLPHDDADIPDDLLKLGAVKLPLRFQSWLHELWSFGSLP